MTDAKEHGGLKLDGVTLDQGMKEILGAYLMHESHDSTHVPADHPVIARQRRISDNTHSIEDIVKGILGKSVKAEEGSADKIMSKLAYELAQTEGFKGKPEEFTEEQARLYLSHASSALGNPTIGNRTEFKKSIVNMGAAKPGDPLYDANSALAQLIQYIATQKDKESRRISYLQTLLQEHGTQPGYVTAMQHPVEHAVGKKFNPTASVADMLGELTRKGQLQSQQYAAEAGPKTYHAKDSHGAH
ncbi:MAG: hypothetical protein AABX25_04645 [Nanoarchaeota archaeon]